MRIAHILGSATPASGGLFFAVSGLVKSLAGLPDTEVDVLSAREAVNEVDHCHWRPVPVRLHNVNGPWSIRYMPELRESLAAGRYDLVHSQHLWTYISIATTSWSGSLRRPYLVSAHGMLEPWALNHHRIRKLVARHLFENTHLRGAACLHALCHAEAEAIRKLELKRPICIIPNGIDLPALPEFGVRCRGPRKRLLYLGRLHLKKGLETLLRAWATATARSTMVRDEWELVIAGWDDGGHEQRLKQLASDLGINTSVTFKGPLFGEAKSAAYWGADAFILPSQSEGLPMVVLEAWAHCLPVLMTESCNLPIGFERDAAIAIPYDPAEMANELVLALERPEMELRAMGARGRELVASQFTWDRVGREMRAVYHWLLGGGDAPDSVERNR